MQSLFLVLTGYTYATTIITTKKRISASIINRYIKLVVMVFLCNMFSALCMRLGAYYSLPNTEVYIADARFYSVCKDAFFGIFFLKQTRYVGVFWTIFYEFWGLVFILVIGRMCKEIKYRYVIYIVISIICLLVNYMYLFMILVGLVCGELYYNKKIAMKSKYAKLLLCVGLCLNVFSRIYSYSEMNSVRNYQYVSALGMCCSILCINFLDMERIKRMLECKALLFLGKHSFAIYGLHYTIISSVGVMMLEILREMPTAIKTIIVYLGCIICTILGSILFTKLNCAVQIVIEKICNHCKKSLGGMYGI